MLGVVWLAGGVVGAQPFEQVVYPFPVREAGGAEIRHPFLGGFNAPRPQLVDIDGDGDPDLFVQEARGAVMFFENVGAPGMPRFVWRTDRYGGLDVGEWLRFADLDGDGDLDVLAEERFSHVRYYRNEGTPRQARFVLAEDTLRDAGGLPVFSDAQNVPALADLTCAGRPDLFVCKSDGTLARYAHTGVAGGVPRFAQPQERYQGLEIIGGSGKREGVRHGACAITFGDVDGDGDADLLWGDFFSPSLYFIENTGTCAAPRLERRADRFPPLNPVETSGYNAPHLADLDGDGDADLLVGVLGGAFGGGGEGNLLYYAHDGGLQLQTTRFLPTVDLGEDSVPALADLDGDGDLDLLVGNQTDAAGGGGTLAFFRNIGTASAPAFRLEDADYARPGPDWFNAAPAVGDLDGDGDPDLLVGGFGRQVAFLRNEGTRQAPRFVLVARAFIEIPRGSHTTPALVDVDGDGDLDLFVGEASGDVNFFRNDGTATAPRFVLVTEAYAGLDAGRRSVPFFLDLDADGDADLLLGTQEGVFLFRNVGTAASPTFVRDETLALPALSLATPAAGDLDGDGDADLLLGGPSGGLRYYRNDRLTVGLEPPVARPAAAWVYPNPFRTAVTFRLMLPQAGHLRIALYDVLGREVARPLDALRSAGMTEVTFDGGALPAGVYLYRGVLDGELMATGYVVRAGK